jgi:hypothetical protein
VKLPKLPWRMLLEMRSSVPMRLNGVGNIAATDLLNRLKSQPRQTCAMWYQLTGSVSWDRKTAVSCRRHRSPNTDQCRIPSPTRTKASRSRQRHTAARFRRSQTSAADIYAFPTIEPNSVVAPVHPKAMPVILTNAEQIDVWIRAPGVRRGRFSGPCRTRCCGLRRGCLPRFKFRFNR